ncbi:hypothetical protein E9993_01380 [Labilibacter sediminis]|nr:hypothetical protein E9993_01380 [Labilibacter sediminis]
MRHIIIPITFLLTLLSCNNNSKLITQLKNQAYYLDKEFEFLSYKFSQKNTFNRDKWGENYNKIASNAKLVVYIEEQLKGTNLLNKSIYENIDSFFVYSLKGEIEEELSKLNKLQYEYWKTEYRVDQVLSKTDVELILIKIKTIRNGLCKEYYDLVERLDYKFPCIRTVVDAESNQMKVGDTYKAAISIGAYDPFTKPICKIGGKNIEMNDGIWYVEIPCKKKGTFKWQGFIKMPNPKDYLNTYPIELEYSVK